MTEPCPLREIEEQIERMVRERPDKPTDAGELFNLFEDAAIVVLDSQWEGFPSGILECHLNAFLYCKQREIGIGDTL